MKARIFFAVWLTAVFSLTSLSFAEVPQMINYQGVLTRSDGEPLDTTISMTFGLYEDSTTLSDLWTETQDSVEVEDGILSVLLGSVNPIPATVFDGSLRYLGIQVGTDDEMSPRRALVSVGNAFHSEFADLAEYAVNPDSDWVVRGDTVYHIGSVGIGMEDPAEKLDVEGNIHASGSIFSGNSIGIETGDAFGPDRLVTDGPVIYVDQEFPWGPNTFTGDIKVGIGDDDPDAFLEVSANAGVPPGRALLMLSSDDATDGDLVVVKDDGDVGIGTPNPSQKLDVDGKIEVGDDATAATAGAIRWSGTNFEGYDGSLWNALDVQSTTGGGWTDDGTVVRLTTSTDSVGIGTTTPNQKLVISEGKVGIGYNQAGQTAALAINGNVGIGTTSPSAKLTVLGPSGATADRLFQLLKDGGYGGTAFYQYYATSQDFGLIVGQDNIDYTMRMNVDPGNQGTEFKGNVGIGTDPHDRDKLRVRNTGSGHAGWFDIYNASNSSPALYVETNCNNGIGVMGFNYGSSTAGYLGYGNYGAYGTHGSSSNYGYLGSSDHGVYGKNFGTGNYGFLASSNFGVYGSSSTWAGVYGYNTASGAYGILADSRGACGHHANGNTGQLGGDWYGVYGISSTGYGVYGRSTSSYGVYGYSSNSYGVYGQTINGTYAGYFVGDVCVTGTINKGALGFKIDHPLDPENRYLNHSGVESPDMMNIYNGNVILDPNGEATVDVPDYLEALNKDFRYQLTAIGGPGPNLHIAEKITDNRFKIAGGQPSTEVSWQVTGIRKDAFAQANRISVEVDKPMEERGKYLHPKAFGLSEEHGVHYEQQKRMEEEHQRMEEEQMHMEMEMERERARIEQERQKMEKR